MKKMIAAAALFAMANVQAEELKFGDLNFIIPAGQFNLSVDADLRSDEYREDGTSIETEGYFLDTLLTYGLSDRLNLFAGLNYQYDVEVTAGNNKRYSQDGLDNPVVGGLFRVMTQQDTAFNLDLGAVARVKAMDAEVGVSDATSSKDGNASDARTSFELFARLGKKWNEANEWQLTAGAIHHLAGEYDEMNVGAATTETEVDSSTDLFVRAAYQYRPVNEFMLAVSAQATQVAEVTEETQANDKLEYDSHLDLNFGFSAKYLITSNFIASFNYSLARKPDFDVEAAGTKVEIDKRRESRMGFGVDWLF